MTSIPKRKPPRLVVNSDEPLLPAPTPGKRTRHRYLIEADLEWLHGLTSPRFIGNGAPRWWCHPTSWLWKSPYSEFTPAELGVLVKLISMFMRDRESYNRGTLETHAKELRAHGLTKNLIGKISYKLEKIRVYAVTGSGEIKYL